MFPYSFPIFRRLRLGPISRNSLCKFCQLFLIEEHIIILSIVRFCSSRAIVSFRANLHEPAGAKVSRRTGDTILFIPQSHSRPVRPVRTDLRYFDPGWTEVPEWTGDGKLGWIRYRRDRIVIPTVVSRGTGDARDLSGPGLVLAGWARGRHVPQVRVVPIFVAVVMLWIRVSNRFSKS